MADWDLVLVGDGSGSTWGNAVGWACVALERTSFARRVFHGCMNDGTVNVAELMAYLAPLSWYMGLTHAEEGGPKYHVRHVHVVTDSQYVRGVGERGGAAPKANPILWGAYQLVQRQGIKLHWHWLPRDDAALNRFADALSKEARLLVKGSDLPRKVVDAGFDPNLLNPWE